MFISKEALITRAPDKRCDVASGSNSTVRLHLWDGSLPLDSFRDRSGAGYGSSGGQLRTCRRTRPIGLPIGDIQGVGRAMLQFVTRKNFQHGRELTVQANQRDR